MPDDSHNKGNGHHTVAQVHPALDAHVPDTATRGAAIDKVVFGVTAAIAVAFLVWGFLDTQGLGDASGVALTWSVHNLGWLFVVLASAFVAFVIWLALSRFGNIPLGRDDEEPEFRTVSWIAMMFSAGMGIGLMFFGVSEPLSHYMAPPPGTGGPGNPDVVENAMATTMFHWSLHPWAIYAVVGIAIAYGVFRKGRSQLISSAFAPLIGEKRATGNAGRVIDMLAIFATLFGSAASLGLGALQIGSGLQIVAGLGQLGNGILVGIIAVLTVCFVFSAVSGVAKGIQWLSNINMVLALGLAIFVFVIGPTVFILNLVPTTIGSYFQDLAMMSARTEAAGGNGMAEWLSGWTVFYWAWWLSWTPFVGMFIARISRGRTIRQFVTGVLLVPSLVSLVWFAIFGGAAIRTQQSGVDIAGQGTTEGQLFALLETMPLTAITTVLVMVLVGIFFVSGADAASIVMGALSQRGSLEPSRANVIFWGVATGGVAAVMLLVGSGSGEPGAALQGLQNLTIVAAVPFVLVMVGMSWALVKDLRNDPMMVRRRYASAAVEKAIVTGATHHGDDFELSIQEADEPLLTEGEEFPNGSHGTNGSGRSQVADNATSAAQADAADSPKR